MKRLGILILSLLLTVFIAAQQTSTFTDSRDEQTYKWVKIGDQIWMAENLNYKTEKGSWCYNDSVEYCETYARLYDWEIAMKVCPDGWHLPSDEEWKELEMYLGMSPGDAEEEVEWRGTDQGTQLKEGGSSGFEALLGGVRSYTGSFIMSSCGCFWSSTEYESFNAWNRILSSGDVQVLRSHFSKNFGFSVRCLRN